MKNTISIILCKSQKNGLMFYLIHNGAEYYLFSQGYNVKTFEFYKNGVSFDEALDAHNSYARRCEAMYKINEKLKPYIRYIEQEYGIVVLRSTRDKKAAKKRNLRETECA